MKLRNRGIGEDADTTSPPAAPPPKTPKVPTKTTAKDYQSEQTTTGKATASKLRSQLGESSTQKTAGSKRRDLSEDESDEQPATTSSAAESPPIKRKRLTGKDPERDTGPVHVDAPAEPSEATPALTWSEKPPIRELAGDEVTTMLEQFEKNLSGWKVLSSDTTSADASSSVGASVQSGPTAEQKTWNQRVDDTADKINAGFVAAYTNDTVTSYSVNEQPVGMLIMTNAVIPYITQMATHPGSTGAGGALMEQAVNKSESWGAGGKLRLKPLNDNATGVYEAWGFKRVPEGMELDPTDNDKWVRQDQDGWRLKKYQDKKYLSGFGIKEPIVD